MLSFNSALSQAYDTTTYYGKMNYIFGNLSRSPITTGLLREYGIDFVNPENYNGKTLHDSNWVNIQDWRSLYATIFSEQVANTNHLSGLDSINKLIERFSSNGSAICFLVAYFNYQGLDSNAVVNNLIRITNGQLFDVAGRSQNPYKTYSAFAVATTLQTVFTGGTQLIFRPELFVGNSGKTVSSIQVDPKGIGVYQTVTLNAPFSVNYTDTGLYTVNIKITYTDGTANVGHTKLAAYNYAGPYIGFQNWMRDRDKGTGPPKIPERKFRYGNRPAAGMDFVAEKLYLGTAAKGDITIDFALSNTTGTIRKPLILVEGFDPYSGNKTDYYTTVVPNLNRDFNTGLSITLNQGLDDINSYDLIYLHWTNGTDYIQRNAYLLETVIKYVNIHKTPYLGIMQQNVIIGQSMGALVARYALRDLEVNGPFIHDTRLFISQDGPHWGANVPVGIQALVQHIAPWQIVDAGFNGSFFSFYIKYKDMFPDAVDAVNLFNSPAAKQMLIQRYILSSPSTGILTADNSVHTSFMNEINALGWPNNCSVLTLSNGACTATPQFPNSSQMISITGSYGLGTYFGGLWRSLAMSIAGGVGGFFTNGSPQIDGGALATQFPLSIITTKGSLYLDFGVWSIPISGTSIIYRGNIYTKRQLFWGLFNSTSYLIKCNANSLSGMMPLDNAPGGRYDIGLLGININDLNTELHNKIGSWVNLIVPQKAFCFVPTVSSLALPNPQNNLFADVCNIANCSSPTQIKGSYVPTQNQIHTSNTQSSTDWLLQIQSPTANCVKVCPTNIGMSGLVQLCTSSTYTITNPPVGVNYAWSSSPANIVSLTPSGNQATATKVNFGYTTITANLSTCGGTNYEVSKYIRVGGYGSGDYPVSGPSTICATYNVSFSTVPNLLGATSYNWFWPNNTSYSSGQNTPYLTINAVSAGSGAVGVRVASTCDAGGSPGMQILTVNSCGFLLAPNPSTGQVTVSMGSSDAKSSTFSANSVSTTNLVYQVKVLDPAGNIRQTRNFPGGVANVTLNLGSLPNGLYTIQVYDNVSWSSEQLLIMK
jgi:hypothetical protein